MRCALSSLCVVYSLDLNVQEKFPEARTQFHAAQVLMGLEDSHSTGIAYCDLKLENVQVDKNGQVKISERPVAIGTVGRERQGVRYAEPGHAGLQGQEQAGPNAIAHPEQRRAAERGSGRREEDQGVVGC